MAVPGLTAEDLARPEMISVRSLLQDGAFGWMVCRAAASPLHPAWTPEGRDSLPSLLLTLSSGSRALSPPLADPHLGRGRGMPNAPHLPPDNAHAGLDHAVSAGAIATLVHVSGQKTAALSDCVNSAETAETRLMVGDASGHIDYAGDGLFCTQHDSNAPYGVSLNVNSQLQLYRRLPEGVNLVGVLIHDLNRVDDDAPLCLPSASSSQRKAALNRLNRLLEGLLHEFKADRPGSQGGVRLVLLSPDPARSADRTDRLSPILLWGSGVASGLLTTGSTQRTGLVVNTDLLASIAAWLAAPLPPSAVGRPFRSTPLPSGEPPSPRQWNRIRSQILSTARLQDRYGGLPTVQMALTLVGVACLRWRKLVVLVPAISTAMVALPLGMLILPPLCSGSVPLAGLLLGFCVLTLAFAAFFLARRDLARASTLVASLCGLLVLLLLIDLLSGMHLLRDAWMSYSVVEGARYYGIGNEYMGTLIGAGCVLMPALAGRLKGRRITLIALIALYGLLIVAMTLPSLGAKVGALPSAGIAFGVALLVFARGRLRVRDVIAMLVIGAALLLLLVCLDLGRAASDQSHLARAFAGAGGGAIASIAVRKLLLEGRLIMHSPWSLTLLASVGALLSFRKPEANTAEQAAWYGLSSGAIACLLCNDSGLTAASMVLVIGWAYTSSSLPADLPIVT